MHSKAQEFVEKKLGDYSNLQRIICNIFENDQEDILPSMAIPKLNFFEVERESLWRNAMVLNSFCFGEALKTLHAEYV